MKAVRVVAWIFAWLPLSVGCGRIGERPNQGRDAESGRDAATLESSELLPEVLELAGRDSTSAPIDVASLEARNVTLDGPVAETTAMTDSAEETPQDTSRPVPDAPWHGDDSDDGPAGSDRTVPIDAVSEAGDLTVPELLGAPLIVAPTSDGFVVNVVLRSGDPSALRAHVRSVGGLVWSELGQPAAPATDLSEWSVTGLDAGQRYEYEIFAPSALDAGAGQILYGGTAVTKRASGSLFTFDLLTDSHIQPCDSIPPGTQICADDVLASDETTLLQVAADIRQDRPDFMIHLGDMLDFHRFGFNEPPPDSRWSRLAYLNYRRLMGDALGNVAHFPTVGNWEGENGCNSSDQIQRSSSQRLLYVPAPTPQTYPEGGSPTEDYYAFTWGDALFVVLNVMTYTPTCHLLSENPGVSDDWTLGATQRAWLEATLAGASSKWRFLFIHHAVGGNAGDDIDSAYGRGGGRAAYVGEQALVHQLMLKYGVQVFFYGHDHVFTDMVVDGIHYTLPGSAGAPWKFDGSITGYSQYWPDSGHGRVAVSPSSVQVDFVAAGGSLLSSYTIR